MLGFGAGTMVMLEFARTARTSNAACYSQKACVKIAQSHEVSNRRMCLRNE
jgi:hypothetical protein